MRVLKWLVGITVAMVLAYFGLVYSYIWSAGLDLQSPNSAREWVKVCARSRIDIYCEAADRVLRDTEGPVIFLHPNAGDDEIASEMTRWAGRIPSSDEADAIARANLFFGSKLVTGTMKTLDGQARKVTCPAPDQRAVCLIDGRRGGAHNSPRIPDDGAIISVINPNKGGYDFLLPEPGAQPR